MANIAIIGAGGFIGSHLVSHLKEQGHQVRAVSKSFHRSRHALWSKADEVMYLNMQDFHSAMIATRGVDYVVHLSADMGGVGYFHAHDYYPFLNNMQMDSNILRACEANKIERLFYASSACVYPIGLQEKNSNTVLQEWMIGNDQMVQPDQMYGFEKLMGLRLCERAPFDARVGILNTVYGPYSDIGTERMKAPSALTMKAMQAKKDKTPIHIWGDGTQVRQFLYISDACEMIERVLLSDSYTGPINISGVEPYTMLQITDLLTEILEFDADCVLETDKPSGVMRRVLSIDKFTRDYGVIPNIDAKEGFSKLITWIKEGEEA